jgi:glycerate kinase
MELVDFDARLDAADLVLTGEGRVDEQTAFGKTAFGVARRARESDRPTICFGGGVTEGGIMAMAEVGAIVVPIAESPMPLQEALSLGTPPVSRAAQRAAELLTLGRLR